MSEQADRFDPVAHDLDAIEAERDALRHALGAELWSRINSAELAWADWHTAHIVHTIATHLPGVGPAIRALAHHAVNDNPSLGCCGAAAWEGGDAR